MPKPYSGPFVIPDFTQNIDDMNVLEGNIQKLLGFIEALREELSKPMPMFKIDVGNDAMKEAQRQLKELETIKKNLSGKDTDQYVGFQVNSYQELISAIDIYKEHIEALQEKLKSGSSTNFAQDIADLNAFQSELKKLQSQKGVIDANDKTASINSLKETISILPSIITGAKNAFEALGGGVKTVISGISSLASSIKNLAVGAFDLLKSAISTTLGNMQKLVSGGFNAVKNGANTLKSAFNSIKSSMQSLVKKHTPNMMKSFASLKSMLMRRIKRTFISSIFNQAKEGLQALAKFDSGFNQSMSNIKNGAKQAAGNLSGALGNLVQALEPAIMTVVNLLSDLFAKLNAVIGLITGKATVAVAKKSTDDYAKSLKKASGAAKDLNHQLYGFDEITRQEDNNSSGTDSGITYEQQSIEGVLGNLATIFENIKKAFLEGNFEEVGRLIAEQLNNVIYKIDDWVNSIRSKATEWASNIARILNGLVEGWDAEATGRLFADSLNLITDVVTTFFKTFDSFTFGKKFGDMISEFFDTVDWGLVGDTVSSIFNTIAHFIEGAVTNIHWDAIGDGFATALTEMVNTFDWDSAKNALVNGINGITEALWTFVNSVDWGDIATKYANHIKGIIEGVNWTGEGGISDLLTESIHGVLSAFEALYDSHFFIELASKFGETTHDWLLKGISWSRLGADILLGLAELRSAFWELINKIDLPSLATELAKSINQLATNTKVNEAWAESRARATRGVNSIITAIGNLVDPQNGIKFDDIGKKIGEGITDFASQINFDNVMKVARDGLGAVVRLFNGFVTGINFESISEKITSGINTFFDTEHGGQALTTIAVNAKNGLNKCIHGFETFLKDINLEGIGNSLKKSLKTLLVETDWDDLISAIGQGIGRAVTEFGKLVSGIFNPIDEETGEVLPTLGEKLAKGLSNIFKDENGELDEASFVALGESIGNAIKDVFLNINNFIKETDWQAIGQSIGNALGSIDWIGIAGSLIQLLWNGLIAAVNLVGGLVGAFIRKLFGITDVEEFNATGLEWANQLADSVNQGIMDGTTQQKILTSAAALATGMSTQFLNEMDRAQIEMNQEAQNVATGLAFAMEEALSENGDLELAKQYLRDTFSLNDDEAQAIVDQWKNSDLSALTLDEIMQGIYNAESREEIIEYFKELGIELPEYLISNLEAASPLIGQTGRELMANLQNAQTLEEAKAYFAQAGIDVGDEFASKIAGESTANIAAALALLGQGVDEATINAMDTSNLSANLEDYMEKSGKSLADIADELGAEVGSGLGSTIPDELAKALGIGEKKVELAKEGMVNAASASASDVMNAKSANKELGDSTEETASGIENKTSDVTEAQQGVSKTITETMEGLPKEQKEQAETMMKYIIQGIEEGDPLVQTAINSAAEAMIKKFKEILNSTKGMDIAKDFISGIKDAFDKDTTVKGKQGEIVKFAQALKKEFSDELTDANGKAIGKEYLNGIKTGMHDEYHSEVRSEISDIRLDIYYAFTEWLNHGVGYDITYNLMQGLADGLSMNRSAVMTWAESIASELVQIFEEKLDEHSPSKVFNRIGSYAMEGLDIGLEREGKNAIDTVSSLADAIVDEGSGIGLEGEFGVISDGLDTTTDKLFRIANIFSDIADTITEMGGLEIPTIASGKAIPYRTQIEHSPSAIGGMFGDQDIEDAVYSAFTRAMGNPNAEQSVNITLQIDGRKMADIVSKYQRQQSRAWGV